MSDEIPPLPEPPLPTPEPPTEPAPADAAEMTADELAEARRYGQTDLACMLADKAVDLVYLAAAALLVARPLDAWLEGIYPTSDFWTLRLAAMYLIVFAGHVAVSFPLSYYSGHVLEHRHGLSTLSFAGWLRRYVKRNVLALAIGLPLVLGLFGLIWIVGPLWWLAAAGAFFVVTTLLGRLMPVLILPLFYKIERLDAPELGERLARLAEGTGLAIEGVYRMALSEETVKANAMLAGSGGTRRVLLGDTLLDGFSNDEIEVVFAHEIGHHVHRHLRKLIAVGLLQSLVGFWICDRLLGSFVAGWDGDYRTLPVHSLPLVMLMLTAFAMVLEPVQNTVSRRFERQADHYALERTGLREAYVSAFRKLARLNKDDPNPHGLEVALFHAHPPIAERLALAERRDGSGGQPK